MSKYTIENYLDDMADFEQADRIDSFAFAEFLNTDGFNTRSIEGVKAYAENLGYTVIEAGESETHYYAITGCGYYISSNGGLFKERVDKP